MTQVGRTTRIEASTQTTLPGSGRLGEVLGGRYRLDRLVGSGGQAMVYQATDLLGSPGAPQLAVKLARIDLAADARAEAVTVLRWEAHLLRRLRHPALPRLHRFQSDSHITWLARDLVTGTTLGALARNGPLAPRLVHGWLLQLCDLLSYLHIQSPPVVCGDLKPANLVLRPDGALALIDLGAAQTLTRRPPRQARPRHGTPGYAPPEQLGNWGHDERSDLFSLAVTSYELLTGLDPTASPLQFDLERLDAIAPKLAPTLRWALAFDPQVRSPSAASLRARLDYQAAPALRLSYGVSLNSRRELLELSTRHPRLIDEALRSGDLERWLALHPDHELGMLLYRLRESRATAPRNRPLTETLLSALAPRGGTPQIQVAPGSLAFGDIPLKNWRVWSRPLRLTIANPGLEPARWELECNTQPDAELRVLVGGKPQRKAAGTLAPGGRVGLELVASGQSGRRAGSLSVRSGIYAISVAWEGQARPGVPLGGQFVTRLAELDLSRPALVFNDLDAMFQQGTLGRWLRAQGEKAMAKMIDDLARSHPDELARRLALARLLHPLAPESFPLLAIHGIAAAAGVIFFAGQPDYLLLEVENLGAHSCLLNWVSHSPWAGVAMQGGSLAPHSRLHAPVRVNSPANTPQGSYPLSLELQAGALSLPVVITPQITPERWWQRVRRWIAGT